MRIENAVLVFAIVIAIAGAPPASHASGPSEQELAKLAKCRKRCALVVDDLGGEWYHAISLPVGTRLRTPFVSVTVPASWSVATGTQAGYLQVLEIGPSSDPRPDQGDYLNLQVGALDSAAPNEKEWPRYVQMWGRPIDARLPAADTPRDRTQRAVWKGQPWMVREVEQSDGVRIYAVTFKRQRMYFVLANASTARRDQVDEVLASLKIR